VSDRHTRIEFEEALELAMRSYAAEGLRSFDPNAISAQAVAPGARSRWRGERHPRPFAMTVLRFAVLVVLLAAAVGALVVGARYLSPAPPISGVLAVGGRDQIVLVDLSSNITRALPRSGLVAHDAYPVWSPDGNRIAFSQWDGRGQLQVMDADGSNRHPIGDGLTSGDPVAWSPDGAHIAFVGYRYPGGADRGLYVVDGDGTAIMQLVPDVGNLAVGPSMLGGPAWSPDGSMIAFAARDEESPVESAGMSVHVVDVASRKVTAVSHSPVDVRGHVHLAWQPRRTALLYALYSGEPGASVQENSVLAERVGDTWQERPLVTESDATYPEWLDAERFAYARDGGLWVAGVDGRQEVRIGDAPSDPSGLGSFPGCVAPDGSALAIPINTDQSSGVAFIVVPTDGRPATRIDEPGSACSWQPRHR
jgi:dipeptidyl aminopeptidase/acylaminoacyl peptidase